MLLFQKKKYFSRKYSAPLFRSWSSLENTALVGGGKHYSSGFMGCVWYSLPKPWLHSSSFCLYAVSVFCETAWDVRLLCEEMSRSYLVVSVFIFIAFPKVHNDPSVSHKLGKHCVGMVSLCLWFNLSLLVSFLSVSLLLLLMVSVV